jgi:hypothetical protein
MVTFAANSREFLNDQRKFASIRGLFLKFEKALFITGKVVALCVETSVFTNSSASLQPFSRRLKLVTNATRERG